MKSYKQFFKQSIDSAEELISKNMQLVKKAKWFFYGAESLEDTFEFQVDEFRDHPELYFHENFFKKGHHQILGSANREIIFVMQKVDKAELITPRHQLYHYVSPSNFDERGARQWLIQVAGNIIKRNRG